jgi:chemotaxis protein MotB
MLPQPNQEKKRGAPAWMVTFGDMMTLLLCFFVLLLSFSNLESERFKIVAGYIREAFGVQIQRHYTEIPAGDTVVTVEMEQKSVEGALLQKELVYVLQNLDLDAMGKAELEKEGVRLRLDGALLFSPGQAELRVQAHEFLRYVAGIIKKKQLEAVVEGHTDNQPIGSSRFPSNWELSAARASAVVRYFISQGIDGASLQAIGFADTRPRTENYTTEGRRKNRRVEILLRTDS